MINRGPICSGSQIRLLDFGQKMSKVLCKVSCKASCKERTELWNFIDVMDQPTSWTREKCPPLFYDSRAFEFLAINLSPVILW